MATKPTRDDSTKEVTAVLTILRDQHNEISPKVVRGARAAEAPRVDQFTILVSLIGKVRMPPYLPKIRGRAEHSSYGEIQNRLCELASLYEECAEIGLSNSDAAKILDKLQNVGINIATYPHELRDCLRRLSDLSIKHLIIHTDEYSVPWTLANYIVRMESEFLCDLYSCGTVLVEDRDEPLTRFLRYNTPDVHQPDREGLGGRQICLIAGEVGQKTKDGTDDVGWAYVQKLKTFLESRGSGNQMTVRCIEPSHWQSMAGKPRVVVGMLNDIFKQAQIVHFTGHVIDGRMQLAKDVLVGPR